MSNLNVILNGARGGQGTSTIAAALALYAAGHARTQLVASDPSATAALLGIAEPADEETAVTDHLTLTRVPSGDPDVRIIDAGTTIPTCSDDDVHLVVLRGPCYVALRSLDHNNGHRPPDGIVLLAEQGRSLTARDVSDVTGIPVVATVAVTPTVARAIDAGLLIARLHRLSDLAALRRYATRLFHSEPPHDPVSVLSSVVPAAVADLNESRSRTPVKIGTDLPVPLCGTGRGSRCCRARRFQRAFPPCTEIASGRRCAEHREAEQRCCGVLHR